MVEQTLILLVSAVLFLVCIALVVTYKERFQYTRYSQMKKWNKPSNPWDATAQIMYSLQLPEECKAVLDEYSKNPTEAGYAKLLNCKSHPGERYYLKKLGTVLQSGVL